MQTESRYRNPEPSRAWREFLAFRFQVCAPSAPHNQPSLISSCRTHTLKGQPMPLKLIPHGYTLPADPFFILFPEELHRTGPRVRLPLKFLCLPKSPPPPPSPSAPHLSTEQHVAAATSIVNCGQWFLDAYLVYTRYIFKI